VSKARKPCRGCGGPKPAGSGRAFCDACEALREKPVLKSPRPRHGERRPCSRCQGPKPPGKGRQFCERCEHFGTNVPEEARAAMVRLYLDEQVSIHEIARRTHWAVGCVHRALKTEGVQMRPVGIVLRQPKVLPAAVIDRTVELYLSGLSEGEVAEQMGVSQSSVLYRLRKAGVERRSVSEANRIGRLRALERDGRAALTANQDAALRVVEEVMPRHLLTGEIALRLRVSSRVARSYLDDLRGFGLVNAKRVRVGRALPYRWSRTDLAIVDVLREAIRPRVLTGKGDQQIDITPLRDWITDLLARERRAFMFEAVLHTNSKGKRPENDPEPIARTVARLGVDPRVLYRILHESRTISVGTADAILAHADGPRLGDLWPEFGEVAA
jgi:predicted DNA-binding protein YlxM (UPF0122 family)